MNIHIGKYILAFAATAVITHWRAAGSIDEWLLILANHQLAQVSFVYEFDFLLFMHGARADQAIATITDRTSFSLNF